MSINANLGLEFYAGLGDGRFAPPLSANDNFRNFDFIVGDLDMAQLVEQSRRSAIRSVQNLPRTGLSTAERVWQLLSSRKYRRGRSEFLDLARPLALRNIEHCLSNDQDIALCISFFPCKLRQPLKTFSKLGSEVDIGELATLLRLYEICVAVEAITNRRTTFHVLCDGFRYKSCFFDKEAAIKGYVENIELLIAYLGLGEHVHLVDESQIYTAAIQDQITSRYFEIFRDYMFKESDQVRRVVTTLLPKIILNMDIAPELCAIEQMAEFYCKLFSGADGSFVLRLDGSNCFQEILQTCISSACRFLAINQTLGSEDIGRRLFPHAIRCTVHPKPGQIGIHTINKATSIFAHCGQGVVSEIHDGEVELKDIRVDFRANLLRKNAHLIGICLDAKRFPFASAHHPFVVTDRSPQ